MHVIGTAGHVDHGKSALVQALTGIHPDRLKEEREREMTIDLGFAWLILPQNPSADKVDQTPGEEVGIVDVPGHRDFIENMLAGIGGIDAALFVVAADEGVMPQTREHLAIINLLQIPAGVVALTKIDLVDDEEWLDLVEEDLHQLFIGTVFEQAPIVRVSARTGVGIPALLQALQECLVKVPPRLNLNRPRLPVDRVFTIPGFGTVVTGTLSDGELRVGDEVEILPTQAHARVRGLQTHKKKEDFSIPGSRTAINLAGIDLNQVKRGDVVARPGTYRSTRRLDVSFLLLPDIDQVIEHNVEVKFFIGAAEVQARLRLLGCEILKPGEKGWLQLELQAPVVAVRGDRYILRRPSPGETIGGGIVIDPHPEGRHKRFSEEVLSRLEALSEGSPAEILMQALLSSRAALWREVTARSSLDEAGIQDALVELLPQGKILSLETEDDSFQPTPTDYVTSKPYWQLLSSQIVQEIGRYYQDYPLRRGIPREELKSRIRIASRLFNAALRKLAKEGLVAEIGPLVYLPDHHIRFDPQQEYKVQNLISRFAASPYSPPSIKESQAEVGEELFNAMLELDMIVQVSPEVVFRRVDYDQIVAEIRRMFEKKDTISAAEVRDHFNTSRRYVLGLLEHLDAIGITVREGDVRRLKSR